MPAEAVEEIQESNIRQLTTPEEACTRKHRGEVFGHWRITSIRSTKGFTANVADTVLMHIKERNQDLTSKKKGKADSTGSSRVALGVGGLLLPYNYLYIPGRPRLEAHISAT